MKFATKGHYPKAFEYVFYSFFAILRRNVTPTVRRTLAESSRNVRVKCAIFRRRRIYVDHHLSHSKRRTATKAVLSMVTDFSSLRNEALNYCHFLCNLLSFSLFPRINIALLSRRLSKLINHVTFGFKSRINNSIILYLTTCHLQCRS